MAQDDLQTQGLASSQREAGCLRVEHRVIKSTHLGYIAADVALYHPWAAQRCQSSSKRVAACCPYEFTQGMMGAYEHICWVRELSARCESIGCCEQQSTGVETPQPHSAGISLAAMHAMMQAGAHAGQRADDAWHNPIGNVLCGCRGTHNLVQLTCVLQNPVPLSTAPPHALAVAVPASPPAPLPRSRLGCCRGRACEQRKCDARARWNALHCKLAAYRARAVVSHAAPCARSSGIERRSSLDPAPCPQASPRPQKYQDRNSVPWRCPLG